MLHVVSRFRVIVAVSLCLGGCGDRTPAAPPDPLEGLVTEVRTEGSAVVAFTLDTELEKIEVLIDPARDYGFDLNHLKEHRDLKQPVLVALERRDGGEYAVSIDDA